MAESNMSSPITGDISNSARNNGDLPLYNKTYIVYGQNFRRTQAEAVHNHGHQLESVLAYVNQRQTGNTDLFWQKFVGRAGNFDWARGRCGDTHHPPNVLDDYDYQNSSSFPSDIMDWKPEGGSTAWFSANTYGSIPYAFPVTNPPQRVESQWYIFWMQSMPGYGNTIPFGANRMTNWWAFSGDWDASINAELGLYGSLPAPATVQFSAPSYTVNEGDSKVTITIIRSGDTSGPSSVDFKTIDSAGAQNCNVLSGAASGRCDFETRIATIRFAAGETSKVVSLLIVDDAYLEGSESFTVSLTNSTGTGLGTQSGSTVTIVDNDSANGANPIEAANFFVRLHYFDFFTREPDSGGLEFWTNQISSCGSDIQCVEIRRINVSAAFYLSIEFQETGYLVERTYKAAYGDAPGVSTLGGSHGLAVPIVRLNEFIPDTQEISQGVVVLQPGWEQQLENNKNAFMNVFVQRPRFIAAFPLGTSAAEFVDKLNSNAGSPISLADRNQLINDFASGAKTRAQVLRAVAENQTLKNTEFNPAFVLMQYFGYLRRDPNSGQDSDYTGYDFWLSKLNQFNGNYINAEMVKAFITSIEYRQRFGT
jgi:hypothetical protein